MTNLSCDSFDTKANEEIYSIFYLKDSEQFLKLTSPVFCRIYYLHGYWDFIKNHFVEDKLESLFERLKSQKLVRPLNHEPSIVWHFFYEFGRFWHQDFHQLESVNQEEILCIEIHYENKNIEKVRSQYHPPNIFFKHNAELPFNLYLEKFLEGRKKLLLGHCYQFNLTFKENYKLTHSTKLTHPTHRDITHSFLKAKEKLGAYAHLTYLGGKFQKLFVSNSPESLFVFNERKNEIYSAPIKGTLKLEKNFNEYSKKEIKKLFKKLTSSPKDLAELDMITDLISNDLTVITHRPSFVLARSKILIVPHLLHQYSLIKSQFHPVFTGKNSPHLHQVLKGLFPGGSITGAPKKRVMEILKELENHSRGFYCSTTVLFHPKIVPQGSINIRSAQFNLDDGTVEIWAGGGITLLSKPEEEYWELKNKLKSFLSLWDQ
jgi:para-aminobenzoate synthetase component 1